MEHYSIRIVFRVDASMTMGAGHVKRCLSLAKALSEKGAQCSFICRDHKGCLVEEILQSGFAVSRLPVAKCSDIENNANLVEEYGSWIGDDIYSDAKLTIELVRAEKVDWLIVDHYGLDSRWEKLLKPHVKKIMVIDDLANREHVCDLLLDQNLVIDYENRYINLVPQGSAKLLGPEFALLQAEYAKLHSLARPRFGPVRRLLLSLGMADKYNLTKVAIAGYLSLKCPDIKLDVVINSKSPYVADIIAQTKHYPNITVHRRLSSLARLMLEADLAIGAGGTTTWERCCLGLPTVVVTVADNQKLIANSLSRFKIIHWLGHFDEVKEKDFKEALQSIFDRNILTDWSKRCMSLVDGLGAKRVASAMMLASDTQIKARIATLSDGCLLLRWANDPVVRQNAFNPKLITPNEHQCWLESRLQAPEQCKIFIVETYDCLPIGQVRLEHQVNGWEIHYSLAEYARKKGLGLSILKCVLQEFSIDFPRVNIFARVKKCNRPSRDIFNQMKFKEHEKETNFLFTMSLNKGLCENDY